MEELKSIDPKWNQRYINGDTPWDIGIPSRELRWYLESGLVTGKNAFEMGCGTGTNALFLAEKGFQVTAVDGAPSALHNARELAEMRNLPVTFVEADVCAIEEMGVKFDLIFDRGCYHCVRKLNLAGYLQSLINITGRGTQFVLLAGNANEIRDGGPPRLTEQEIRGDFDQLFEFRSIKPFRFDDLTGATGPLGWSCLLIRR